MTRYLSRCMQAEADDRVRRQDGDAAKTLKARVDTQLMLPFPALGEPAQAAPTPAQWGRALGRAVGVLHTDAFFQLGTRPSASTPRKVDQSYGHTRDPELDQAPLFLPQHQYASPGWRTTLRTHLDALLNDLAQQLNLTSPNSTMLDPVLDLEEKIVGELNARNEQRWDLSR